ncbi:hypothetical protein JCM4914_67350 [Streptomyces platensis subsp. malvinus]
MAEGKAASEKPGSHGNTENLGSHGNTENREELPEGPANAENPVTKYPQPEFPEQDQEHPGWTGPMDPPPDHGEESYRGSGLLEGRKALLTGGDSGIGRAVALAFAREGADVLFTFLPEEERRPRRPPGS